MKIYYITSDTTQTSLLVRHHMKPYLVTLCDDGNKAIKLPQEDGDSCKFAFERFLKFALVPWEYFDKNSHMDYDFVVNGVKSALRDVS